MPRFLDFENIMRKSAHAMKANDGKSSLGDKRMTNARLVEAEFMVGRRNHHLSAVWIRLMANFRVTRFFMRNGLILKRLEKRAPKNSPPASASARIFSGKLFLHWKKLKVGKDEKTAALRRKDIHSALFRVIPAYSALSRLFANGGRANPKPYRQISNYITIEPHKSL